MKEYLGNAELLKKQIEQKKGKKTYLSELATLMWYGEFKGEYIMHVDMFVNKLIPFCQEYFSLLDFLQ